MAANEFRQRRGVAVRTYTLTDSAVIVRHRGVLRRTEMRRAAYLYRLRSPNPPSVADELEKLAILRNRGDITAEEFERLKARLIGPDEAPPDDRPNEKS